MYRPPNLAPERKVASPFAAYRRALAALLWTLPVFYVVDRWLRSRELLAPYPDPIRGKFVLLPPHIDAELDRQTCAPTELCRELVYFDLPGSFLSQVTEFVGRVGLSDPVVIFAVGAGLAAILVRTYAPARQWLGSTDLV